jgi:hypothetical protein
MDENMNTLFDILDGIVSSDDATETLSSSDAVINYAEAAGFDISYSDADKIIAVGQKWVDEVANGNGEWSRMREDAKEALAA